MKKLSEIGSPMLFHNDDGKSEVITISFTPSERRELVRAVWVSSRNELAAEHANLGRALTFEEFLEKEGL
jgi:hypothetical protein